MSVDDQAAQKAFKAKYNLPFTLISDPQGKVLEAFGVAKLAGYSTRQAFLIKDGKIVWHDATASTDEQAQDVLAEMNKLDK